MKKLLLFVLIAGIGFSASAQRNSPNNNNRDYGRNNDRGDYGRHSAMDRKIRQINYEYDAKIADVQHQYGLRARVKNRRIARLEHERFAAIERCKTFNDARSRDYANGQHGEDHRW